MGFSAYHLTKTIARGADHLIRITWTCFVQFLPMSQKMGIFDSFRFSPSLQISKHLIACRRVAGKLLYPVCIVTWVGNDKRGRDSCRAVCPC